MLMRLGLLLTVSVAAGAAQAQSQRDCGIYARDYAAVVAPRSGASTIRNTTNGYPTPPNMGAARQQAAQATDWATMAPHQNTQRKAYDDCMARAQP